MIIINALDYVLGTQKAVQVASAGLFVDLKYHQPLFSVIQYLSECTLFKKGDRIGGIEVGNDPSLFIRIS